MNWIFLILMFVVMYVFLILPQNKQRKKEEKFRNSLEVGQDVVTIGGLHGTVKSVGDTTVTLRVATGVDIVVEKRAIALGVEGVNAQK